MDESRIERDIEDLSVRIRAIEGLDAPLLRQHMADFRELRKDVRALTDAVQTLDVTGTALTNQKIHVLEADVERLENDAQTARNVIRSALITASFAIVVNIIVGVLLYVVLK